MSNMVKGVGAETVTVDIPFKIVRDRSNKSVITRSETKDYRIVDEGVRIKVDQPSKNSKLIFDIFR